MNAISFDERKQQNYFVDYDGRYNTNETMKEITVLVDMKREGQPVKQKATPFYCYS